MKQVACMLHSLGDENQWSVFDKGGTDAEDKRTANCRFVISKKDLVPSPSLFGTWLTKNCGILGPLSHVSAASAPSYTMWRCTY